VFGREAERAVTEAFLDAVPDGPAALVLEGEAGIGKTSLWSATVEHARGRGWCVLTADPTTSEAGLSFAALTDLLAGTRPELLIDVPVPQRRALDIALLRVDPEGALPDHRALATGFLSVVTVLAREAPVLIGVDDVQWLDAPSARILEFALRRLGTEPVGTVVCARLPEQTSVPLGIDRALPQDRVTQVRVGPLEADALHGMVEHRMSAEFPRRVLARIAETSSGNPFFALEIARALLQAGSQPLPGEDLPMPESLTELVAERIAALPSDTRELLSAASVTANPTIALLDAIAEHKPAVDVLAPAEAGGIVAVEGERVRFSHPLVAAAVWSSISTSTRSRIHRRLSELVTEPEEKAKHLATVATGPDEEVAAAVAAAASHALARGAPDAAAELFERSVQLTPIANQEDGWRRASDAAACHAQSGDDDRARAVLEEVIASARSGPLRAGALLQLGNIVYRRDSVFSAIGLLSQALDEAGTDAELRSGIERWLSTLHTTSGNTSGGLEHARAALDLLDGSQNTAAIAQALANIALGEFVLGGGLSRERMEWALKFEDRTDYPETTENWPSLNYGVILLMADEPGTARAVLAKLQKRLREEGDERGVPYTSWLLGWVDVETGRLERAATELQKGTAALKGESEPLLESFLSSVAALVHAWRGEVDQARAAVETGLRAGMQTGVAYATLWNTSALGFLELSLGNADAAHRCLGPLADLITQVGVEEPGVMRFLPDEIEARVALGELDGAAALLEPFETMARRVGRRWAIATAGRCRGLLSSARGDPDAALVALEGAIKELGDLPYPLELGRTLVVKGRVHRRRREKRAAREALDRALEIFEERGARLWAETAGSELARLGGRPAAPTELTATEQRVAELAAAGLTNREVAEAAFLAPKTVEGVLARVYRKLGIRSRAELGASMAARRAEST
jgi:DNA-binding CsgD family transcriptional regulator